MTTAFQKQKTKWLSKGTKVYEIPANQAQIQVFASLITNYIDLIDVEGNDIILECNG